MLYILNLHIVMHQLYLKKLEGKKIGQYKRRQLRLSHGMGTKQVDRWSWDFSLSHRLSAGPWNRIRWIFAAGREREKVSSSLQTFLHHVVYAVEKTPVVWPPGTSMWCWESIKLQRPTQFWAYIHFPLAPLFTSQSRGGWNGLGIRRTGF